MFKPGAVYCHRDRPNEHFVCVRVRETEITLGQYMAWPVIQVCFDYDDDIAVWDPFVVVLEATDLVNYVELEDSAWRTACLAV